MFDLGWSELLVILIIGILLIGPKEIPGVMYQMGKFFRRISYMRFALQKQFDHFMDEHDLNDLRNQVSMRDEMLPSVTDDEFEDPNQVIRVRKQKISANPQKRAVKTKSQASVKTAATQKSKNAVKKNGTQKGK